MTFDEFLISTEFAQYRKEQIKLVCDYLRPKLMAPKHDTNEVAGALEIARKIIDLPRHLLQDKNKEGYAAQLDAGIKKDFVDLRLELLRGVLINESDT